MVCAGMYRLHTKGKVRSCPHCLFMRHGEIPPTFTSFTHSCLSVCPGLEEERSEVEYEEETIEVFVNEKLEYVQV